MFLRNRWLAIFAIFSIVLLLGACGGKESGVEESEKDKQDELLPLSEALETYPVWFRVNDELTRHSEIKETFVFKDGKVQRYYTEKIDLHIEDIIHMSDEEVINYVQKEMDEYVTRLNIDENFQPATYTLDIVLDDLGHDTQFINIESENKKVKISLTGQNVSQTIYDTTFAGYIYNDDERVENFITRVDDSILFTLDDPNTDKENVTVEAWKEREKEEKELQEEETNEQLAEKEGSSEPIDVEPKQPETKGDSFKKKYLAKADELEERIISEAKKLYAQDTVPGFYGQYYEEWDKLLNEVWGVLKDTMPKGEFEELLVEQRAWINEKDETSAEMPDETASQRASIMDYLAFSTKERTYYLIEYYMD